MRSGITEQKSANDPNEFAIRVAALFDRFNQEVHVLQLFFMHLPELVASKLPVWESLSQQMRSISAGLPQSSPSADAITIELTVSEEQFGALKTMIDNNASAVASYEDVTRRMGFIYVVALFDAFISDLLYLILTTRPEALKSSKQLTYRSILDAHESGDIVQFLANREVTEVGYKNIKDQFVYFRDKFNIAIPNEDIEEMELIRARRNLLVHTGGMVTPEFLTSYPALGYAPGQTLTISPKDWEDAASILGIVSMRLRQDVLEKFAPGDKLLDDPFRNLYGPLSERVELK